MKNNDSIFKKLSLELKLIDEIFLCIEVVCLSTLCMMSVGKMFVFLISRLGGSEQDVKEIIAHPFFRTVNWQDLVEKKVSFFVYYKYILTSIC